MHFTSESLNQIPEDSFYQEFHILEWLKSTETFATFLFMLPHLVNTCQWLGRLHCKVIFYTFQSEALFRHVSKLSQVLRIKHKPQVFSQGWKGFLTWGMLKPHKFKDCLEACEQECQELTPSCCTPNLCCRSMKTQKHQVLITMRHIPRSGLPAWPMTDDQLHSKSTHPVQ